MLKKALKVLLILIVTGILLFSVFLYLLVKGVEGEKEQEKGFIIDIINTQKVIVEATGVINDVERKLIAPLDDSGQDVERISFSGKRGKAVIEGVQKEIEGVVYIDGTITLNGQSHPMVFQYPDGKTEFTWNIDWDFEI